MTRYDWYALAQAMAGIGLLWLLMMAAL